MLLLVGKNEMISLPHTIYKINTRCVKDLNVISKTMKLLEKMHGKHSSYE